MSLSQKSLGSAAAAARGVVMSAATAAQPVVVTLTAGHRQRNGSRIAIAGSNTSDLSHFGEWSLSSVAATSAALDGSNGTATLSGTPVVALLCDQTPFLPRHRAVAVVHAGAGGAETDGIATAVIEAADTMVSTGFQYDSSGTATSGFKSALKSGEIAIPAFNDFGSVYVEVDLSRYMTFRLSSWTSGTFGAELLA